MSPRRRTEPYDPTLLGRRGSIPIAVKRDAAARGRITRSEAAKLIGVSLHTVRRYEVRGWLSSVEVGGAYFLDLDEVKNFAKGRDDVRAAPSPFSHHANFGKPTGFKRAEDGEIAARIFACFDRAMTLPEIVVAEKIPPAMVRSLWTEYQVGLEDGELERRARDRRIEALAEERRRAEREHQDAEIATAAIAAVTSPAVAVPKRRKWRGDSDPLFAPLASAKGARIPNDPNDALAPAGPIDRDEGEGD